MESVETTQSDSVTIELEYKQSIDNTIANFTMREVKQEVRDMITESIINTSYLSPTREVAVVTLVDGNLEHERQILRRVPFAKVISLNKSNVIIQSLRDKEPTKRFLKDIYQSKSNPNFYLAVKNILDKDTKNLVKTITKKQLNSVYWFDFCGFAGCFNESFSLIKILPKSPHKTVWLTFALCPRVFSSSDIYEKEFGYTKDMSLDEGICLMGLNIINKMKTLGYNPIDLKGYPIGGGKMLTIGFRQPYTQEQIKTIRYNKIVDLQEKLNDLGFSASESASFYKGMGNVASIGGLGRAITCKKNRLIKTEI